MVQAAVSSWRCCRPKLLTVTHNLVWAAPLQETDQWWFPKTHTNTPSLTKCKLIQNDYVICIHTPETVVNPARGTWPCWHPWELWAAKRSRPPLGIWVSGFPPQSGLISPHASHNRSEVEMRAAPSTSDMSPRSSEPGWQKQNQEVKQLEL